MPGFNDLFSDEITFTNSTHSKLPLDKNAQEDAILSLFINTIPFADDTDDLYIKYIDQTDDDTVTLGKIVVSMNNEQLSFPFVIKNNNISPFDIFMVNNTVYPAHSSYLKRFKSENGMGSVVKKEDGYTSDVATIMNNTAYAGNSISDVLSKIDSKKLSSYFKANPKIANLYFNTKKGESLNNILTKIARDGESLEAYSILSAVADPISAGTVKIGILTTSGYIEDTSNIGEAEKTYPEEIAYLVKKALATDEMAYTHTTRDEAEDTPTQGVIPTVRIDGPLKKKGNMIEWDGTKLNYELISVDNPKRLQIGDIKAKRQYVFFDPKSKTYTLPLFINLKVLMDGQTVLNGTDCFKRKVHAVIDPKIKHIYKQDGDPVVALIPPEWHIYHIPASKYTFMSETSKIGSLDKHLHVNNSDKILVSGNKIDNKWIIKSGTNNLEFGGNSFNTLKCATILNYYIGEDFKKAISGEQNTFNYKQSSVLKTSSLQYNTEPIFIKLAALIPDDDSASTLLELNYITPDTIKENNNFLPKLEDTIIYLSELLLTARLTNVYPENDIKKAIEYLIKVKKEIKQASYKYKEED